jgi:serine/threonine-protein phosphatase 5
MLDTSSSPNMPLPIIPSSPKEQYTPTKEFVEGMIEGFRNGGKLPRRVVWEIVLGVKAIIERERSMVEVTIKEGQKCTVVGDSESCDHVLHPRMKS